MAEKAEILALPEEELVARFRVGQSLWLALAALAFVVGCLWLLAVGPGEPGSYVYRRYGWMFPWMPWSCIAFFGACGLILGWSAVDRRPQLRVSSEGIWWRRWSTDTVPWAEVEDVESILIRGDLWLRLPVRNHQRFPAPGVTARLKTTLWSKDMTIPVTQYDRSSDEILAAIERHRSW